MVDEIYALLTAKAYALVRRASADLALLLDPGFVYANASGMTFDKATYIDVYCTSGKVVFSEQRISDLSIRQFEGFAVATLGQIFCCGADCVWSLSLSLRLQWADRTLQWAAGHTVSAD
jgi:hypothetical protein